MQKNITIKGLICYLLATLFLGYEMALQVSPAVITEELMQEVGLNAKSLSLISASYFFSYAAMQIPAGALFDKYKAKILLTLSCAICTFGIYLFVLTKTPSLLALGRFITGFGSAFAFIGVLIMANEWFKAKHFAVLVGIAQFIAALGAMFGEAPLAAAIEINGWQNAIVNLAIIGVTLTALNILFISNNRSKVKKTVASSNIFKNIKKIICNKNNLALAVYAFACWGPVTSFAELWGVAFLKSSLGVSKTIAAEVTSSIWLGIAMGAPVIGMIAAKYNNALRILKTCALLGFISTSLLIFGPVHSILVAHLLAFTFGIAAASQILTFAMIKMNSEKSLVGTAIGFMNMAVVAGGAILQPTIGYILHHSWDGITKNNIPWYTINDYQQALMIIPICFLICIISSHNFIKNSSA